MRRIEMHEFPVFRGEDAVRWLNAYMDEIDEEERSNLTERDKAALKKIAETLISVIEAEVHENEGIKESRLQTAMEGVKKAILRSFRNSKQKNRATVNGYHCYQPLIMQRIR